MPGTPPTPLGSIYSFCLRPSPDLSVGACPIPAKNRVQVLNTRIHLETAPGEELAALDSGSDSTITYMILFKTFNLSGLWFTDYKIKYMISKVSSVSKILSILADVPVVASNETELKAT